MLPMAGAQIYQSGPVAADRALRGAACCKRRARWSEPLQSPGGLLAAILRLSARLTGNTPASNTENHTQRHADHQRRMTLKLLILAALAVLSLGVGTALAQEGSAFMGGAMPSYHVHLPWLDGATAHASDTRAPAAVQAPKRSASIAPATRTN
jgi:hypothetical protein